MGDMSIPLRFASLYDGQDFFVWSDCRLDLGMDVLIGNMLCCYQVLSESLSLTLVVG